MQRIDGFENLPGPIPESVVTVGKFFAVHIGHRALIQAVRHRAARLSVPAVVVTFDRHPREILTPGTTFPVLASLPERLALIEEAGAEYGVIVRVNEAFLSLSPEAFVHDLLMRQLGMREILVGENFRFGRGASGTVETLRRLAIHDQFDVTLVSPIMVDGEPVSSSRIAAALRGGDVAMAERMLGRSYSLPGRVVEGDHRGREIGFPTANVDVDPSRLLPADGVYAATAKIGEDAHPAVVNIGVRPTFGASARLVEAHLLDASPDLYGVTISLEFRHRLRGEVRFPSVEALRDQIRLDITSARLLLTT